MNYQPIAELPEKYKASKRMFVAIGINVDPTGSYGNNYTTDPYCVWCELDGYARWPHAFAPTHFCELPEVKK